jgi:hypothetical protein
VPVTPKQLQHLVDTFDWDKWNGKVRDAIEPHYTAIAVEQGERAVDEYGLDGFDADDPFVDKFFTGYLGERITQIDETTREKVTSVLQDAVGSGASVDTRELADRIRTAVGDAYAFSPARGLTIARTETAFAVGHGAGLAFKQNGIEHVEISDGDGDDECEEADGQIWTVDEYLAEVIAHPNCVRSAAPADGERDNEE